MKIRLGFISNSSSSSFIVSLNALSKRELERLLKFNDVSETSSDGEHDSWTIIVNTETETVEGWTNMDNGDLGEYLKAQDIDDSSFKYN